MSASQPGRVIADRTTAYAAGRRVERLQSPQTRACLSAFRGPAAGAAGRRVERLQSPQTRACLSAFRGPAAGAAGRRVERLQSPPTRLLGNLTPAGHRRHTEPSRPQQPSYRARGVERPPSSGSLGIRRSDELRANYESEIKRDRRLRRSIRLTAAPAGPKGRQAP